jgi:hypothetical protein
VAAGAPKIAMAVSPMYFSSTPPYWRTTLWTAAKYSCCVVRTSSGSSCSANGVKSTMSTNSTLTRRRSSRGAIGPLPGRPPRPPQKLSSGPAAREQCGQVREIAGSTKVEVQYRRKSPMGMAKL